MFHDLMLVTVALISCINTVVAYMTRKATGENKAAIQEVHLSINSRMDSLLKLTGESEAAKGKLEGVAEQKAATALETKAVADTMSHM